MTATITNQKQLTLEDLRFEYGTCTFTTTSNVADVTIKNIGWGAPDGIIKNGDEASSDNEELLSLGAFTAATGVQVIQRDGNSTLADAAVINYMLVWKD